MQIRVPPQRPNRLVTQLLELIEAERLAPGDRLPSERDLARRFSVSRPAVREALVALQSAGICEIRSNSGVYLRPRDAENRIGSLLLFNGLGLDLPRRELEQSIELRRLLESLAVDLAARRATQADLAALRAVLDEGAACLARGETIEAADERFHLGIVRATRNDVFFGLMQTFLLPLRARRAAYFADLDRCRRSQAMHEEIFAAIAARKPQKAARLMRLHMGLAEDHHLQPARDAGGAGAPPGTGESDQNGGR